MGSSTVVVERHPRPLISFGPKQDKSVTVEAEDIVMVTPNEYGGPYVSLPSASRQVYATAYTTMREDFTVEPIAVHEAPNDYGTTLTIGD